MKIVLFRIIGVVLILGAVIGLLMAAAGLVYLWSTKESVTREVTSTVSLLSRSLHTTRDGLLVVDLSLKNAQDNLSVIKASIDNLARALDETDPTIQSVAGLMGNDLPDVVISTRRSLTSAQDSAKLVDDTLRIVSAIPLIGARYKPTVPLQTTVEEVSNSLRDLPNSFYKIQTGILTAGSNLKTIKSGVTELSSSMQSIDSNLSDAAVVVRQYEDITGELVTQADQMQSNLTGTLNTLYTLLTILLGWTVLVQIGLFTQGLGLLSKK